MMPVMDGELSLTNCLDGELSLTNCLDGELDMVKEVVITPVHTYYDPNTSSLVMITSWDAVYDDENSELTIEAEP